MGARSRFFDIVDRVLESKGKNVKVSNGWWQSFRNRNPNMILRTSESLSYIRAVSSSPEIINHYFDLLESTIVDNCLLGKPSQIFNMDETGMPLDPNPPFVVAPIGAKHVSYMRTGDKFQITVITCCNTAGYAMPPTVVFDRKQIRQELTYGEIPGTTYAGTGNGGEYKQWNGLLEWNTGLDYWNDFFDLNLLFLLAMLAYSYFENYVRDESSKMWAHNKHIDFLCVHWLSEHLGHFIESNI